VNRRWGGPLALAGILLVALNLRPAVASLSPIIVAVERDIPLDSVALGILGMLAPACFAFAGLTMHPLSRRVHAEWILLGALVSIVGGQLIRATTFSFTGLLVGGIFAFVGMGVANVLLPPLVKKYFPRRIGLVTSLYVTLTSVGALVPPLLAVPLQQAMSWRESLGSWAVIGVLAIIPWIAMVVGRRSRDTANATSTIPNPHIGGLWKSRIAWGVALIFAISSFNGYAMFAWLPPMLVTIAGTTETEAGQMLSLFAAMGIPAAILVPILANRMREPLHLVYPGVAAFVVGYLGLILAPTVLTWLWVATLGLGTLIFPLSLLLVNLRTLTYEGSIALSGFVQGVGYVLGALGPLSVGVIHAISGGWIVPLIVLLAASVVVVAVALLLMTPGSLENPGLRRPRSRPRATFVPALNLRGGELNR
jgi:CP family cyanate transporter-like MFS transporter